MLQRDSGHIISAKKGGFCITHELLQNLKLTCDDGILNRFTAHYIIIVLNAVL